MTVKQTSSFLTTSNAAHQRLDDLWRRGRDFLGSRFALLGGAMSWVSERHLVAAISNGGGFGVLASGSMPPDLLAAEIEATAALTGKPFGVNLILVHPQLEALAKVCVEAHIGHVVLAGGMPPAPLLRQLKEGGVKIMAFAPTATIGQRLVRSGVDALIVEGMEAGGHIGAVATSVLAQEILPAIRDVPVFVAGGIGRGEAIAAYLEMGAAGCQLGTRFVCASESIAHPAFKQAFIKADARDAVASVQIDSRFPVIPVRALRNRATEQFAQMQRDVIERFNQGEIDQRSAHLEIEHFWSGALRRAVVEGDIETGSLMAGQSVGMVTSVQPTAEILAELVEQAIRFLARRHEGAR